MTTQPNFEASGPEAVKAFPMPDREIALLDVDGTLIDARYEVTDPAIYPTIAAAQDEGWTIGLNSELPTSG
ncbi:MAG TPA: hypothetical protein VLF40_05440 [Candidatus Saccharimonadales bacterium]|nr:hypothetical protein [Candidatus Saccharimonadales bacterium]